MNEGWTPTGRTFRKGMFIEKRDETGKLYLVGRYGGLAISLELAKKNGFEETPDERADH